MRHREERSDAAIQSRRFGSSSLDRFACARDDDDRGSTKSHNAPTYKSQKLETFRPAIASKGQINCVSVVARDKHGDGACG
jgi:hypothetical protein